MSSHDRVVHGLVALVAISLCLALGSASEPGITPAQCTIVTGGPPVPARGVVCGSPERASVVVNLLENTHVHTDFRGYKVTIGYIPGDQEPIFVANHEIGSSGAAFLLEELIARGAETVIRLGSSDLYIDGGGKDALPHVSIIEGELGPLGLLRDYGFDASEWDTIFKADEYVLNAMEKAASTRTHNLTIARARGYSVDAYFSINFPSTAAYNQENVLKLVEHYDTVLNSTHSEVILDRDMECGAIYVVGFMRKVRVGCALQSIVKGGHVHANPGTFGIPLVLEALTYL